MTSKCSPLPTACKHGRATAFTAALRSLVNNPEFSDVKFLVGKERREVFAHRCILACRCEVFHGMFSHHFQRSVVKEWLEEPLVLSEVQPDVFLAVIEFLYTNCVSLNKIIALEVLTSAVEYGLNDLRKLCIEFITDTLTAETVSEAFQAAVTFGQIDMRDKCLEFIENCTKEVVSTRGFYELSDVALLFILKSDHLLIDELELLLAVREWAHVNALVLERPIAEVAKEAVREVRLFLLSPEELTKLENENHKDNLIPVEQIAEVWKFHALKKWSPGAQSHLLQRRKGTRRREHHRYLNHSHK
ncbi:BTB/POZ domain-containing protein 19-like isoform X1 [Polypterus senegalus]|uniref:BTB/POZ domain-containing protein 19-like isoform X1 n=1 Tax=Polypterus senegalus TaxID=55291 RepID=UPI0019649C9C|nr:BTB/POZ domain-containing protein 19-like isoform X1 [Polypterus senegalus]